MWPRGCRRLHWRGRRSMRATMSGNPAERSSSSTTIRWCSTHCRSCLSREGYQVTGFGEGASFLAAAQARTPTCIILDVQMPGQSGLDILKELNAQHYPAPIFIISGSGDIPMAVEAIKNGALDFIEKPFDAATVVTRVREAIEAWSRRAQARRQAPTSPADVPGPRSADRARARRARRRSPRARRTSRPAANSASHRAPSRCIARASWKSSAPRTPPIWCASC